MRVRCSTCDRVVDPAGTHSCWSAPAPSLRAELAEAKAEIARLTEERDYAADPFNWEARWTGDEVMGWAITHGNYIQIGEEQGQVFMRMRAVAAVEEGQKT